MTLISSAFTALLNCAEVGRRNRILTNDRFLSHSLLSLLNPGVLSVPNVETDSASLGVPAN